MTIKELLTWAIKAQAKRENSWVKEKREYSLSISQATEQTRPILAGDTEFDMVVCLNFNCWNEVQDWVKEMKIDFPRF